MVEIFYSFEYDTHRMCHPDDHATPDELDIQAQIFTIADQVRDPGPESLRARPVQKPC